MVVVDEEATPGDRSESLDAPGRTFGLWVRSEFVVARTEN